MCLFSQVVQNYKDKTAGVFILCLEDYLKNFWGQLEQAQHIYQSLKHTVDESQSKGISEQLFKIWPNASNGEFGSTYTVPDP